MKIFEEGILVAKLCDLKNGLDWTKKRLNDAK